MKDLATLGVTFAEVSMTEIRDFSKSRPNKTKDLHTNVHTYECTYIRMYIHTNVHTYECTYIRMYIHTNVHTYECTYIRMYIHTNVHTYKCTYIRMYIHTNVHTYIFSAQKHALVFHFNVTAFQNTYILETNIRFRIHTRNKHKNRDIVTLEEACWKRGEFFSADLHSIFVANSCFVHFCKDVPMKYINLFRVEISWRFTRWFFPN
jgi:hypothetical protein